MVGGKSTEREYAVTFATLHTTLGPIRLELFDNHAPKTVRNFIELAEGTKEYTDPRPASRAPGRTTTASSSTG